jgi:hypothetical protein
MRRPPWELILAFLVVLVVTVWYLWRMRRGVPTPGGFVGHSLGVVGFLLMLSTETLYSIRKRTTRFPFGPTRVWLQIHVFTGIVGPFLVILHTGGRFQGLAGVLTLVTVLIVVSGFVGRYIYTAIPRALDGVELAAQELEQRIHEADARVAKVADLGTLGADALMTATALPTGWRLVFGRHYYRWQSRRRIREAVRKFGNTGQAHSAHLEQLLDERNRLQMQIDSLAVARRLLALWHVVHVPLGGVLFTLAFVHIVGALYYATFLK